MSEATETIYVLDELELRPETIDEFLEAFEEQYRPGAEARGMELLHTWVTPPEGPPGANAVVILVWGLEGIPGFWTMRSQNSAPEVAEWWRYCESLVVKRSRRHAVDPRSRAAFAAAGRVHA